MALAYLILDITESNVSVINNTSNVTVKLSIHSDTSYNLYSPSGAVTINGTSYSFTHTFDTNQTTLLFSKTVTIKHANDGTASVTVSAWFDTEISAGTIYANKTKQLTKIVRGAEAVSINTSSAVLGQTTLTVTIQKRAMGFEYYKYMEANGKTYTYGLYGSGTGQETWSWTPPLSLSSLSPNSASFTMRIGVLTKQNGSEVMRSGLPVTVVIPNNAGGVITYAAGGVLNGYTSRNLCLQNHSTPTVNWQLSASGLNGATVTRVEATFGDQKKATTDKNYFPPNNTGKSYFSFVADKAGQIPWTVKVTDSRGNLYTRSGTLTVVAYEKPKILSFSVSRGDSSGNLNMSGTNAVATYEFSYTDLSVGNRTYTKFYIDGTMTKSWYYSRSSGTVQKTKVTNRVVGALSANAKGDVTLTVTDAVGNSVSQTVSVSKALVLMDFSKNGVGIGVPAVDGYCTFDQSVLPVRGLLDSGSNSNGSWIKFSNGIMICWHYWTKSLAIQNSYGNFYICDMQSWTYPQPFKSQPTCVFGQARWATGASYPIVASTYSTYVDYWAADSVKRTTYGTTKFSAMVIGKWK